MQQVCHLPRYMRGNDTGSQINAEADREGNGLYGLWNNSIDEGTFGRVERMLYTWGTGSRCVKVEL